MGSISGESGVLDPANYGVDLKRGVKLAAVDYYPVRGRMIGEKPAGGARVRYVPDALGSVNVANDGSNDHSATYQARAQAVQG